MGATLRATVSSPWFRRAARALIGVGVLVAVIAQVGSEPFVHGVLSIDLPVVVVAVVLSAVATAAAAWRWSIIAGRLGVGVDFSRAVGMYYRSQFLNTVLPGGVIGDVQRAVTHGRDAGDVGQGARAVVIERTVGQLVQLALAVVVVAGFGFEFEGYLLAALGIVVVVIALAALVVGVLPASASGVRVRRALRRELDELALGVGSPGASVRVVAASIVVVACHVATFGVAVAAIGSSVPPERVAALALVVLLAGSIPFNLGGWGPREGIAGWAFAVAGLGASAGVAAATLFGVLAMIAVAPGLVLAGASALRGVRPSAPARTVALTGAGAGAGTGRKEGT
ncbi:lysylphosphatidylglycerol synthase transmembrane domain-containing protein [Agromyces sp. MMS24-JH15]|uniref:lysylphosphatidylglycerol synthase transmembrane domain-containing protein n=1 Tax=Agromyces sp. MMS24-JH15 TaxID=3243765 RepID=UPI003749F05F